MVRKPRVHCLLVSKERSNKSIQIMVQRTVQRSPIFHQALDNLLEEAVSAGIPIFSFHF